MRVLVTGGAGYIGAHTCLRLLECGHEVAVVDSLVNSSIEALSRVRRITGRSLRFFECDIRDKDAFSAVLREVTPDSVIHFAGLKSVFESVNNPYIYYDVNTAGTLNVAKASIDSGVERLVFSSSATVYGSNQSMPLTEDSRTAPINPYGQSKLFAEHMLKDLATQYQGISLAILRYFNPVGAHDSGLIGEDPKGEPANLMPVVARVAASVYPQLKIFGDDYDTPDGTGIRDYIHVMDLADAHIQALLTLSDRPGTLTWNVGRGQGISVAEMVDAFERVTGQSVARTVVSRREGDVAESYADATRLMHESGWAPTRGIDSMIGDLWRWQSLNPQGYSAPNDAGKFNIEA